MAQFRSPEKHRLSFDNSEVSIRGKSNVSAYECVLQDFSNAPHRDITSKWADLQVRLTNAVIQLRSESFNCGNPVMTRDFRKALKAETYPHILIEIKEISLHKPHRQETYQSKVPAKIAVTLAGITQSYHLHLTYVKFSDSCIVLKGTRQLSMSEYDIEAPTALLGIVKAEEKVHIDFLINLNILD